MGTKTVVMPQQTILILQGGGAPGAFRAGVLEAMEAAGHVPDRLIGASIGAVNAVLIAGNRPQRGMEHVYEFWSRAGQGWFAGPAEPAASLRVQACNDAVCLAPATVAVPIVSDGRGRSDADRKRP